MKALASLRLTWFALLYPALPACAVEADPQGAMASASATTVPATAADLATSLADNATANPAPNMAAITSVTTATPTGWGAAGLLQTVLGLVVVIGLIFLCAWGARRLGLQKLNSGQLIKVVASTAIGQRERVVVVEIGDTWLALGVTPGQIQSLHSMPAQELPASAEPQLRQTAVAAGNAAGAFAQKLRESLGRK